MSKSKFVFTRDKCGRVTERLAEYNVPENGELLSQKEGKRLQREQCIAELRKLVKPGQKVYCNITKVSKSGMSRRIQLYVVVSGELQSITWNAEKILGWSRNDDGLLVSGCGMNMCFHTVYTLGRYLFPQGFGEIGTREQRGLTPLKKRAKDREHALLLARQGFKFPYSNGQMRGWIEDGGYALKESSL